MSVGSNQELIVKRPVVEHDHHHTHVIPGDAAPHAGVEEVKESLVEKVSHLEHEVVAPVTHTHIPDPVDEPKGPHPPNMKGFVWKLVEQRVWNKIYCLLLNGRLNEDTAQLSLEHYQLHLFKISNALPAPAAGVVSYEHCHPEFLSLLR